MVLEHKVFSEFLNDSHSIFYVILLVHKNNVAVKSTFYESLKDKVGGFTSFVKGENKPNTEHNTSKCASCHSKKLILYLNGVGDGFKFSAVDNGEFGFGVPNCECAAVDTINMLEGSFILKVRPEFFKSMQHAIVQIENSNLRRAVIFSFIQAGRLHQRAIYTKSQTWKLLEDSDYLIASEAKSIDAFLTIDEDNNESYGFWYDLCKQVFLAAQFGNRYRRAPKEWYGWFSAFFESRPQDVKGWAQSIFYALFLVLSLYFWSVSWMAFFFVINAAIACYVFLFSGWFWRTYEMAPGLPNNLKRLQTAWWSCVLVFAFWAVIQLVILIGTLRNTWAKGKLLKKQHDSYANEGLSARQAASYARLAKGIFQLAIGTANLFGLIDKKTFLSTYKEWEIFFEGTINVATAFSKIDTPKIHFDSYENESKKIKCILSVDSLDAEMLEALRKQIEDTINKLPDVRIDEFATFEEAEANQGPQPAEQEKRDSYYYAQAVKNHYKQYMLYYNGAAGLLAALVIAIWWSQGKDDDELVNESRSGKKYKNKEKHVLDRNNNDDKVKADHFYEEHRKEIEAKEDKKRALARVLQQAEKDSGISKPQFQIVDQGPTLVKKGVMEPFAVLNYDTVFVRIGQFEKEIKPKEQKEAVIKMLSDIQKFTGRMKQSIMIGHKEGQELVWTQLTNHAVKNQSLNSKDLKERLKAVKDYLATLAPKLKYTDEDVTRIAASAQPAKCVEKMLIEQASNFSNESLMILSVNESMMGGVKRNLESIYSSIMRVCNLTYSSFGHGIILQQHFLSVCHNVCDNELKLPLSHAITISNNEYQEVTIAAPDYVKANKELDCFVARVKAPPASLKPFTENSYTGLGYIITMEGSTSESGKGKYTHHLAVGNVYCRNGILYHYIPTQSGDSGAPIFTADGKVIGLHKAYTGVANIGVPIQHFLKEILNESVMQRPKGTTLDEYLSENEPVQNSEYVNQGAQSRMARVDQIDFSYLSRNLSPRMTNVINNEFANNPNCRVMGAVKYKKSDYDKLQFSRLYQDVHQEYGLPDPPFDDTMIATPNLASIKADFSKYVRDISRYKDYDVYQRSITVMKQYLGIYGTGFKGISIEEAVQLLDPKKATGWPQKTKYFTKGDYFDKEMPSVHKFLDNIYEFYSNPDWRESDEAVSSVVFDQVGKEELRKTVKVMANKIRSINSSSANCVAVEKMLFQNFLDKAKSLPFNMTHTTNGWSPYYGNWDELVKYIAQPGWRIFTGIDFVKWDSTVDDEDFKTQLYLVSEICDWTDKEWCLFWWFIENVIETALCVVPVEEDPNDSRYWTALLVMIFRGMKSGQLLTLFFNCLINIFRHIYSIIKWAKHAPGKVHKWLYENVTYCIIITFFAFVACGDDFTFSTSLLEFNIDKYKLASQSMGYEMELVVETDINGIEFAGITNRCIDDQNYFIVDIMRLLVNVAIQKRAMTIVQYAQKIDNLIRIGALTDPAMMRRLIAFRDALGEQARDAPGMAEARMGFCTLEEAVRMQFKVNEGVSTLNNACPHKNDSYENENDLLQSVYENMTTQKSKTVQQKNAQKKKQANKTKSIAKNVAKQTTKKSVKRIINNVKRKQTRRLASGPARRRNTTTLSKLARSEAKRQIESVVMSITAPGGLPPVRYCDEFSDQPTAVANPFRREDTAFADGDTFPLPQSDFCAIVFRDAIRSAVIYDPNIAGAGGNYDAYFNDADTGISKTFITNPNSGTTAMSPEWKLLNPIYWQAASNNVSKHNGDYMGVGWTDSDDGNFIWINAGESVRWSVTNTAGTPTYQFRLDRYYDGTIEECKQMSASAAGNQTIVVSNNGYYSMKYRCTGTYVTAENSNITVQIINAGLPVWKHLMLPYLTEKAGSISDIRVNAGTIMFSNTAPELSKNGKCVGVQFPGERDWFTIAEQGMPFLEKQHGATLLPANKGIFGFLKPTALEDFEYKQNVHYENGEMQELCYELDSKRSFVMIYGQIPVADGRAGYFTVAHGVEYLTNDVWLQIQTPGMTSDLYKKAIESIRSVPQFHENPLHLSDLFSAAKRVAQFVVTHGPTAIKIASLLTGGFGGLVEGD